MRDPERIRRMLEKLDLLWRAHPDMRLGQLVMNVAQSRGVASTFYVEDDDFEGLLDIVLKEGFYGNG